MINKEILKQIIIEQKELIEETSDYVERESIKEISSLIKLKHIIVITGHRRSGKSVFLSQIIRKFYGNENVYYLNFDDERLGTIGIEDMNDLMEAFHLLFGKKKIIFLDEIQNLEGWERFVSRLYNERYKIFITGSNAKLLSSELSTHLTGRYVPIEIFPFSFSEFLKFEGFYFEDKNLYYKTENKAKVLNYFNEYLKKGGFPEMVKYGEKRILTTLFSDIITKDVVNRYEIREVKTLKEIAHFLITNSTNEFSYNKIKNIYGLGSVHTVKNYIEYLTSTYMFFELSRFSYSLKDVHSKIKKIYVIDNGFIDVLGFSHTKDLGKLLENLVHTEMIRRKKEVFYFKNKNGKETDFLIREGRKITGCIQVCYNCDNEKTLKREINSLILALKEFNLKEGIILSREKSEVLSIKDKKIIFIPVWKWILGID